MALKPTSFPELFAQAEEHADYWVAGAVRLSRGTYRVHFPWMNSPMSLDSCSSEPWFKYIMCPAG